MSVQIKNSIAHTIPIGPSKFGNLYIIFFRPASPLTDQWTNQVYRLALRYIKIVKNDTLASGIDYFDSIIKELFDLFDCSGSEKTSRKWYQIMANIGLDTDLKSIFSEKNIDYELIEINSLKEFL